MKKLRMLILAVFIGFLFVCPANANLVVGFDDLARPSSYNAGSIGTVYYGLVPTSYAGFSWTGWEVMANADVNKYPGNTLTFPSQSNAAYPGDSRNTITSDGQAFNFLGAYLASFVGGGGAGSSLSVTGYLGAQNKGTQAVALTNSMIWTAIDFQNVDRLVFASNGYYLLDNFTTSAVPIPAAVWLLGTGLVGLFGVRRRFMS